MARSKVLTGLGLLMGVVAVGVGIGWFASRPPEMPPPAPVPVPSVEVDSDAPNPRPRVTSPVVRSGSNAIPTLPQPEPTVVPAPAAPELIADWEDKLDEILSAEDEDTEKVEHLLAMFPKLPPEGQDEVAQHLSNLIEDEDYEPLKKLATDASLPEEVLDTLLADLLNRPNATKLPMFLEIAFTPGHPMAEEARDLLELFIEPEDELGPNRRAWEIQMNKWLAENPD